MKSGLRKKTVKQIRVDLDKCTACRACELACSAFHAVPKYSSTNPARARIRVVMDELRDVFVPIRAGDTARAECMGRDKYTIGGKEYDECCFCRASCPSRDLFKEPDSGLPLNCDMCENEPPLSQPMCVQVCQPGALTYEERDEESGEVEEEKREEIEVGLDSMVNRFGLKRIIDIVARMSKG